MRDRAPLRRVRYRRPDHEDAADRTPAVPGAAGPADRIDAGRSRTRSTAPAGLRTALQDNHDGVKNDICDLDRAADQLPVRLSWRDGLPGLVPAAAGVRGALAEILVAVYASVADDTWWRLKLCPANDCRWAYLDESKNRSRNWCGLGCANRAKTRAYRARQRAHT